MDVLCEVQPADLTDDPEDGNPVLEIEAHEEGYLAKILLGEGESCEPDLAIAVVTERAEDVAGLTKAYEDLLHRPTVEPATFAWQAYLAAGHKARACSNS